MTRRILPGSSVAGGKEEYKEVIQNLYALGHCYLERQAPLAVEWCWRRPILEHEGT